MNVDYSIISENPKVYSFDGNLEEFLVNVGVSSEHITNMKLKLLKDTNLLGRLNDTDITSFDVKLVPVDKIIGIRRACPNITVFDNVAQFKGENGFNVTKMIKCLNFANKMSYDELKISYSTLPEPVELTHIVETDEYYLSDEHNHTTICAMIFNAPFIKAKVIESHPNHNKTKNYYHLLDFYKKYNIARIEKNYKNSIRIVIEKDKQLYRLDYDKINITGYFEDIISEINEAIVLYNNAAKTYKKIPFSFLRKIYYNFFMTDFQRKHLEMPQYLESNEFHEFYLFENPNRNLW